MTTIRAINPAGATPREISDAVNNLIKQANSFGTGSVSSVALSCPSFLTVSGSPITSSGTLTVDLATQAANKVFAGPTSGGVATPTFRSLVAADIPSLPYGSGTVTSVSVTTANGVSGTVATATTTPAITLALGAITPTSVLASGTVGGSNLSGTNTGDQTTVSGNAGSATILATGRTIAMTGDVTWTSPSFNGSANVTAAGTIKNDVGLAGNPTTTTQSGGNNSTRIATTAFVHGEVAGVATTGRLLGAPRYFTSGSAATYTATAGTNFVIIEIWGGGAGGSGVANPGGGGLVALGGGGQAGGKLVVTLTANFSGGTYTIGAKGTGGTAGANAGTAGGNTTFTISGGGTTYTAAGGAATGPLGTFAPPFQWNPAAGNATTGGDVSASGAVPFFGFTLSTGNGIAQSGGLSEWGGSIGAALTGSGQSVAGNNATGYAGGGSGAIASGTVSAKAGGDGFGGLMRIWEFS